MTQTDENLTIAPLTNVGLCLSALQNAMNRTHGLPGIVEMHGPSGWGKSVSAGHAALRADAYYVEVQSCWTRKYFLLAILEDMGIAPAKTIPELMRQIAEQMTLSRRPLIVDEAGLLLEKDGGAKLVKDLSEATQGTIMLIGEETLPALIGRWERLDGRVLEWVPAQPVSVADARLLTRIYANGLELANDIIEHLVRLADGSVRRVAVNLDLIRKEAAKTGWETVSLSDWGSRTFYTGKPPARRKR
jgi:hypothetical protein